MASNIRRHETEAMVVESASVQQLPTQWLEARRDGGGRYSVRADRTDYMLVSKLSADPVLRREVFHRHFNRGWPENEAVLLNLLSKRRRRAQGRGHESAAAEECEHLILGDVNRVGQFFYEVDLATRSPATEEAGLIASYLAADGIPGPPFQADASYYSERICKETTGYHSAMIEPYLSVAGTLMALADVAKSLFDLDLTRTGPAEDFYVYNVARDGERLGTVVFDLYARKAKIRQSCFLGVPRLPGDGGSALGVVVCNLESSRSLTHKDVVTIFHEFGHFAHQLLSDRQSWAAVARPPLERDAAEIVPAILEEWAWDSRTLLDIAQYSGKRVPDGLMTDLRHARDRFLGIRTRGLLFYASMAFSLHAQGPFDSAGMRAIILLEQEKYQTLHIERRTHVEASFLHMFAYGSATYGHLLGLVVGRRIAGTEACRERLIESRELRRALEVGASVPFLPLLVHMLDATEAAARPTLETLPLAGVAEKCLRECLEATA